MANALNLQSSKLNGEAMVSMHAEQIRKLSDEELVQQCQEDLPLQQEAFTELFKRYRRYAYQVALRYIKNREDAQDIVQEAFIRVYFHLPKFRGDSSFKTWLTRIVINLSLTYRLAQNRKARFLLNAEHEPDFQLIEQSLVSPVQEQQFWTILGKILRRMRHEYRKAFILRYFKNRPLIYIAHKLRTTLNGAKMKISRAKSQFLAIFQRLFG